MINDEIIKKIKQIIINWNKFHSRYKIRIIKKKKEQMKPSASVIIWFREGQYSAIILEKQNISGQSRASK